MKRTRQPAGKSAKPSRPMRLPGFLNEQEIGLGDVIGRATSYAGIKACAGCQRRTAILNRWIVFGGRPPG